MAGVAVQPSDEAVAAENRALREQVRVLSALVEQLVAEIVRLGGEPPALPPSALTSPPADVAPRRAAPPAWVTANVPAAPERPPRTPRVPVPRRRREEPDRQVVHAPDRCTHCGTRLAGGRVVQRRQLFILPAVRVEVGEHLVLERTCRWCRRRCRGVMPDLSADVGPPRRVGWEVAAWVAVLRTKLRLPLAQLQWLVAAVWGLHLARGGTLRPARRGGAGGDGRRRGTPGRGPRQPGGPRRRDRLARERQHRRRGVPPGPR